MVKRQVGGKLGLSFHRTFPLSRPAVSQVLRVSAGHRGPTGAGGTDLSFRSLRELTNLGTVYVEAMPRYARGAGLISEDGSPSQFGRLAFAGDPSLARVETQWLMHYHLC